MLDIALAALDWASAAACSEQGVILSTWLALLASWTSDQLA